MRAFVLVALLLLVPLAMASPLMLPVQGDADVPAASAPIASVVAFDRERFAGTEGVRTRIIAVPEGWDRVVLVFTSQQDRDPWDRLVGVGIGGLEVLKATTPRTTMTLTKDVTEYASLLPQGGTATVQLYMGTYVGALLGSVRLDFYRDEPTALLVAASHEGAHAAASWAYLGGPAARAGRDIVFADEAPSKVTLELRTSGHYPAGEFWWMETPPAVAQFRVLVNGEDVGRVVAMPYVYALIGFSPSVVVDTVVHPVAWWTAQRAADAAGVHGGTGEIPAYRAEVEASQLPLFTGARHVEVVQDTGAGIWITSVNVLVE